MMSAFTTAMATASAGSFECPAPLRQMASFTYSYEHGVPQPVLLTVCEDLRTANGSMTFFAAASYRNDDGNGIFPLTLAKAVVPMEQDRETYLDNMTKMSVLNATTDIMGNKLLGVHGNPKRAAEATLAEIYTAIPPLRSVNGARVWTANRGSGVDASLDARASNRGAGSPDTSLIKEVLPGINVSTTSHFVAEGLLGGDLPLLLLGFAVNDDMAFYEEAVAPQQRDTGKEQPVFFRFLQVNKSVAASEGKAAPGTLYFDTYTYVPSMCEADTLAGCDAASDFFGAVLDTHFFWSNTWEVEHRMELALPSRSDTNGTLLATQATHALVLDMIVRTGEQCWPRYGTNPGYNQPGIGTNGFQEIFTASMTAALEWGLEAYTKCVLETQLSYFMKRNGFVLYRGLEMPEQGRSLAVIAMYYRYTQDSGTLLKHLDKITGIVWMLRQRIESARAAWPNTTDSRHGMPTGDDEADLVWAHTNRTELPFLSIASEAWRGLRDIGAVLEEIAAAAHNASLAKTATAISAMAPPLLAQLRKTMAQDAFHPTTTTGDRLNQPRCFPYVAGVPECGMLSGAVAPSNRDSEPWRTYSELFYSGALKPAVTAEILAWHQTQQGSGVKGSRLKLGVLSGCGGDVHCGDSLETFTIHGFAYGLLLAELIEEYLLQFLALSAHAYTRGTWIAPESTSIDRSGSSASFATPAGVTAPILLKWLHVFDDPTEDVLWLGKAIPRVWLSEGETVDVRNAPSSYGRVSYSIHATTSSSFAINVTLPERVQSASGGVRLRVRALDYRSGKRIHNVFVGGKEWQHFNATAETVDFPTSSGAAMPTTAAMQRIVVTTA